jgi:hypothetical protein
MQMGNKGAFIRFTALEMKPDIVTFSAVVCNFSEVLLKIDCFHEVYITLFFLKKCAILVTVSAC